MPYNELSDAKVTVHVGNKLAKEYNITGDDTYHSTCYIEAQIGKPFVVKVFNSGYNVDAAIYIDGQLQASDWIEPEFIWTCDGRITEHKVQTFVFTDIALTGTCSDEVVPCSALTESCSGERTDCLHRQTNPGQYGLHSS